MFGDRGTDAERRDASPGGVSHYSIPRYSRSFRFADSWPSPNRGFDHVRCEQGLSRLDRRVTRLETGRWPGSRHNHCEHGRTDPQRRPRTNEVSMLLILMLRERKAFYE